MTTDRIKALAHKLYEAFRNDGGDAWMGDFEDPNNVTLDGSFDFTVIAENLAAIEALKPMADREFSRHLREVASKHMDGKLETEVSAALHNAANLIDVLAAAPPASPAPVDDGERVRAAKIEAFDEALSIAEGSYSYGEQQNEIIAGIRAALAAINGEK